MAVRFRPQTVQLQECFCCSFIFRRTASFSTLTRDRRSSSPSSSQNCLMFSRSACVDVFHIRSVILWVARNAALERGGGGAGCDLECGAGALVRDVELLVPRV